MALIPLWLSCSAALPEPPEPGLSARVSNAVSAVYGEDGMGWANNDPDGAIQFVSLHRKDDHVVYITHGVAEQSRFPHEFVLRVRHPSARSDRPLMEVAPAWPVQLLREIAEVERHRGEVFGPRDFLGNIRVDGAPPPYPTAVFLLDPVLRPIEDGELYIAFVQVVPFDGAAFETMKAIPDGETNTLLKERMANDPLGLVDG